MKKFRVHGNVNVVVTKDVWANTEEEAYEKAYERLSCLTAYCGNGGYDKLVGVQNSGEAVDIFDDIEYDDIELLEEDPDYFECPGCNEECDVCESDDGSKYYHCSYCDAYYDEDGDEFYPDEEEDE